MGLGLDPGSPGSCPGLQAALNWGATLGLPPNFVLTLGKSTVLRDIHSGDETRKKQKWLSGKLRPWIFCGEREGCNWDWEVLVAGKILGQWWLRSLHLHYLSVRNLCSPPQSKVDFFS